MARLIYGGLELSILKTHAIHTEDVYDPSGVDLLWVKYTFDVTGIVNPRATTYTTQAGNPNPPPVPGSPAFLTIAAIRDTLSQPRQPLTYIDEAGNVMVQSPALAPVNNQAFNPGGGHLVNQQPVIMDCDCDGGPKPLRPPEVLSVQGTGKTVLVRFAVSTTVNDSVFWSGEGGLHVLGKQAPKPPLIVSNRWSAEEHLDEAAFSTRTHKGRAIFRADLLRMFLAPYAPVDSAPGANLTRLAVPDDFRSYWGSFYCPKGFQRKQVWVQADPSGFGVDYQITDVQLPVTLTDNRACKLSIVRSLGVGRKSPFAAGAAFSESLFSLSGLAGTAGSLAVGTLGGIGAGIYNLAHGNFGAAFLSPITGIAAGFADSPIGASVMPQGYDHFVITAEGQPGTNRNALAGLCYRALMGILSKAERALSSEDTSLTVDYMGKWARLEVSLRCGPSATFVRGVSDGLKVQNVCDLRDMIPADDGITDPPGAGGAAITTAAPGVQPVFPNDSNLRGARFGDATGTLIEALVAQSLMYPYTEAPQPPGDTMTMQGFPPP